MMPVPPHLREKAFNHDKLRLFVDGQGTLWITGEDMGVLTDGPPYYIVNDEFDPVVRVDYEAGKVYCDERGGWSRTYDETFADLEDLAKKWEVEFDVAWPTLQLAEMAYKLIYSQMGVPLLVKPKKKPRPIVLADLPEPEVEGGIYHEEHKIMYNGPVHFTKEQMLAYGEACVKKDRERKKK